MLRAADQGGEGPAQHAGLRRASFVAEIEREIGLCRGEPVALRAGRAGELCRQPVLHPPFGGDLQRGDPPAQRREIEVGSGFELPAQRRDRGGGDRGDRSLAAGELAGSEKATVARSEPKAEEDQIHIAVRAVLDRDQRVGDPGPGIERQREPPEGLAGRVVFTARMPHYRRPMKLARFVLYGTNGVAAGAAAFIMREPRALTMDLDVETLKAKLAALKIEHRDLDDVIARIAERRPFDQLQLQRLKKRKLRLKDQISKIESELLPDIIA